MSSKNRKRVHFPEEKQLTQIREISPRNVIDRKYFDYNIQPEPDVLYNLELIYCSLDIMMISSSILVCYYLFG